MNMETDLTEAIEAIATDRLDRLCRLYAACAEVDIPVPLRAWNAAIAAELLRALRRREGINDPPDEGSVVIAAATHLTGRLRVGAIEEAGRTATDIDDPAIQALHRVLTDILRNTRQTVTHN